MFLKGLFNALLVCVLLLGTPARAQSELPPIAPEIEHTFATLVALPAIVKAFAAIESSSARMFEEQVRLNEIPAPPFKEQARAEYYVKKMRALGLADAYLDKEGNAIGIRRGNGKGPKLVVSAHLDTVFPAGTDVKVREKNGRFYAPGIGDDALGLTSLLTAIDTINKSKLRTVGDIIFVGTVGEEGLGDLRGVKALFRDMNDIDGFISLDGVGFGRIVYAATGSHRFLATFKGPGGHSFAAFGLPSAIHAMGRAVAKIADLQPPSQPKTTFTVGTVKGGTSVNAIAGEAQIGIDVRSNSHTELVNFVEQVMTALHEAVQDENKRWNSGAISVDIKQVGDRPAGNTPVDARIVQAARVSIKAVGADVRAVMSSSTDSNLPISLGIPAITLSCSGQGGGSHSLGEWYTPVSNWIGAQNILLLTLALAGVEGVTEPVLEKRTAR